MNPLKEENSNQNKRFGLKPPKGILFHGPPGTGKTRLAIALGTEVSKIIKKPVHFIYRKGNDTASKWFGESSKNLRQVFEEAKANKPTILFFDELDGLCPNRDSARRSSEAFVTVVTTMLGLIDDIVPGEVFIIGGTNRIQDIDPALRRPGRFDKYLEFFLPGEEARHDILRIHTKKWKLIPSQQLLTRLSKEITGFSGADLAKLCMDAFDQSLCRHLKVSTERGVDFKENFHNHTVKDSDWDTALSQMKPSVGGVFGSTQYVPVNSGSDMKHLEPLFQPHLEKINSEMDSLVAKASQKLEPNLLTALYIWTEKIGKQDLSDFILTPLLGKYGGDEIRNLPKFLLSAEVLNCVHPHNWPNLVNNTFLQAIRAGTPSILCIKDFDDLCESIKQHQLCEQVTMKSKIGSLRGTQVILVVTGCQLPEELDTCSAFHWVICMEAVKVQIDKNEKPIRQFLSTLKSTGDLNYDGWLASQGDDFLREFDDQLRSIEEIIASANGNFDFIGLVDLHHEIYRHVLLSAACNNKTGDVIRTIGSLVASFEQNLSFKQRINGTF